MPVDFHLFLFFFNDARKSHLLMLFCLFVLFKHNLASMHKKKLQFYLTCETGVNCLFFFSLSVHIIVTIISGFFFCCFVLLFT